MKHVELLDLPIRQKLHSLKTQLRVRLLLEGVAWLLLVLGALVVVTFAFDYTLRLEKSLRGVILGLCCIGVFLVLWRRLVTPLGVSLQDENLALLVENHHGQLGDRLISALQLTDRSAALACGMSGAMIDRMAEEANRIAAPLKFSEVVETTRVWKLWAAALVVVLGLGGFSVAQSDLMGLWFQRNVMFAEVDWPQDTYLRVFYVDRTGELQPLLDVDEATGEIRETLGDLEVLRGDDLEIVVETTAGSEAPDFITIHARYPSEGDTEERRDKLSPEGAQEYQLARADQGVAASNRTYYRKKFLAVSEEFRFYVTGGDDRRDKRSPHQIRLVNPPALYDLTFALEYPAYMEKPPQKELDGSRGVLALPLGVLVQVKAKATKDIASAEILLDNLPVASLQIRNSRELKGQFSLTGENQAAIRTLQISLKDTADYENRYGEQYLLQIIPDLPPSIMLGIEGVRNVVCPKALVPLVARARDDYGVETIRISYSLLKKKVMDAEGKPVDPADSEWLPVGNPIQAGSRIQKDFKGQRELDLEPLKLTPGMELEVQAECFDKLPAEFSGPNSTRSNVETLHIITVDELLGQLLARQREVSMEFLQAIGQHELSRGHSESVANSLDADKTITKELKRRVKAAANTQRLVINESAKAANVYTEVAREMELNRVSKAEDIVKFRTVATKLHNLMGEMRSVVERLGSAGALDDPAGMQFEVSQIAESQPFIGKEMNVILKLMHELEKDQEIAQRVAGLERLAEEIERTIREIGEGIDSGVLDSSDKKEKPNE